MKRLITSFILLVLFASLVKAELPSLAVMDQENKTDYKGTLISLESGTAGLLINEFAKTKRFKVIESAQLIKMISEQKLEQPEKLTPVEAANIGKILGIKYMVIGDVNEFRFESSDIGSASKGSKKYSAAFGIEIKVIDTDTGEIVSAATDIVVKTLMGVKLNMEDLMPVKERVGSYKFSKSLIGKSAKSAIENVVSKVVKDFGENWSGIVTNVSDDGVLTINGGSVEGIAVGDFLEVYRKGRDKIDQKTRELVSGEEKLIGEIRITEVNRMDSLATVLQSETAPQPNDKVIKILNTK
jgi:curli biogenesis system outer membrane secretion channel CsgG